MTATPTERDAIGRPQRYLAALGLVLFALAWFLPVHEDLDERTASPPGWFAFRMTWEYLWKAETWSRAKDDVRWILWSLTGVTNLVMLGAAVAVFAGVRANTARAVGYALLACVALNASWFYVPSPDQPGAHGPLDVRDGLRVGYWLWLASFGIVGTALVAAKDEQTSGL